MEFRFVRITAWGTGEIITINSTKSPDQLIQSMLGGELTLIGSRYFNSDVAYNPDAKHLGLPRNELVGTMAVLGFGRDEPAHGDVIFTGKMNDDEELTSLTNEDAKYILGFLDIWPGSSTPLKAGKSQAGNPMNRTN